MRITIQLFGKIMAVLFVCLVGFDSYTQELATHYVKATHYNDATEPRQGNNVALDKVLSELEVQYKIRFAYEDKTIENKFVDSSKASSLKLQSDNALEKVLEEILQPLALSVKKVGDYYVVKEVKPSNGQFKKIKSTTPHHTGEESGTNFSRLEKLSSQPGALALFAQEKTIQGQVIDATSETGLPGVNILGKGSTLGT